MSFEVEILGAQNHVVASVSPTNDPESMDYATLLQQIEPTGADPQWATAFNQLAEAAGPTVGDYVGLLSQAANVQAARTGTASPDPLTNLEYLVEDQLTNLQTILSGYVYMGDTSDPLDNVDVAAVDSATGNVGTAFSTSDGLVRFTNLPPGTYTLSFLNYLPPQGLGTITIPTAGTVSGQTWILRPGGTIQGVLLIPPGTAFPQDDAPAVTAADQNGNVYTGSLDLSTGDFTIPGLPAGTLNVTVSSDLVVAPDVTGVQVTAGNATQVGDIMASPGGVISGTVLNASNQQPVAGAFVTLFNDNDPPVAATTDSNGDYTLPGLAAGTYQISVVDAPFLPQTEGGIVVTAGEQTTEPAFMLGGEQGFRESSHSTAPPRSGRPLTSCSVPTFPTRWKRTTRDILASAG